MSLNPGYLIPEYSPSNYNIARYWPNFGIAETVPDMMTGGGYVPEQRRRKRERREENKNHAQILREDTMILKYIAGFLEESG